MLFRFSAMQITLRQHQDRKETTPKVTRAARDRRIACSRVGRSAEKGTGIVPGSAENPEPFPEFVPSPLRVSAPPRAPSGQQKIFVAHPGRLLASAPVYARFGLRSDLSPRHCLFSGSAGIQSHGVAQAADRNAKAERQGTGDLF